MISIGRIVDRFVSTFKQKMVDLCHDFNFSQLNADLVEEMTSNLSEAASASAAEGLRCYVESFDTNQATIEHDDKLLRSKGKVPKSFLTCFGEMTIERSLYQHDRGGAAFAPLDAAWGMRDHYATLGVREAVCFASAHCTPAEVHELLGKCAQFRPSTTAIKHIIGKVGEVMEENQDEMMQAVRSGEQIPQEASVLVVSADGANVLMRLPGSRHRRPAERPQAHEQSKEALKQSSYKNAMVGSISLYAEGSDNEPQRLCSRYTASMPQDNAIEFKQRLENEVSHLAENADALGLRKVLLMDGSRALWNYAQTNPLYEDFEFVIDFYHTADHLSKASEALFGKSSRKAKHWFGKWRRKLLTTHDAAAGVLRSIEYYSNQSNQNKLSSSRRKALKAETTFFRRNGNRMQYASLRERHMPIGSGPVEAACKSIVKNRLCRSGMRWSHEGGQNILTFRTLVKSQRWEDAWQQYKTFAQAA